MNLDDQNFLQFLSKEYPYLYDVEIAVRKIQTDTGFGEVSLVLRVESNKVDKASLIVVETKMYRQRQVNVV